MGLYHCSCFTSSSSISPSFSSSRSYSWITEVHVSLGLVGVSLKLLPMRWLYIWISILRDSSCSIMINGNFLIMSDDLLPTLRQYFSYLIRCSCIENSSQGIGAPIKEIDDVGKEVEHVRLARSCLHLGRE